MDKTHELAVVGDASSIRLFHALGMRTEEAENAADAERAVHRLARGRAGSVIYITEQAAALMPGNAEKIQNPNLSRDHPDPQPERFNRDGDAGNPRKRGKSGGLRPVLNHR